MRCLIRKTAIVMIAVLISGTFPAALTGCIGESKKASSYEQPEPQPPPEGLEEPARLFKEQIRESQGLPPKESDAEE